MKLTAALIEPGTALTEPKNADPRGLRFFDSC